MRIAQSEQRLRMMSLMIWMTIYWLQRKISSGKSIQPSHNNPLHLPRPSEITLMAALKRTISLVMILAETLISKPRSWLLLRRPVKPIHH